jgi:hypothetical protein
MGPCNECGMTIDEMREDKLRNAVMESGGEVYHCDTDSGFQMTAMTSSHSSDRDESATFANLFTIIFRAAAAEKMGWSGNFQALQPKRMAPSAHGGAPIRAHLLKYSAESAHLSVYGQSARLLAHLRVVRVIRGIHQMLTSYCRITQTGSKETSTTIANAEDRYAQSLV